MQNSSASVCPLAGMDRSDASAFARPLMVVCVFLAAERQRLLPNVFLLAHWVVGLVDDGFVNHRVSGLSAAGAFRWRCCWLIHGSCSGCFPNAPVTRCISEKFRFSTTRIAGFISLAVVAHFVFGAGTAGLRGFAHLHVEGTASSRAGVASTICCSHLPAETRGSRWRGS